jgi:hypothetical protein
MGHVFMEGRLEFRFGDGWTVEKYDGHPDYRNGIQKLQGSNAVDFAGLRDASIYFIEVKDFRGYRIENKQRMSDGALAQEVAEKVRDSIAGIIGASHVSGQCNTWVPFVSAFAKRKVEIRVVLWLEEDRYTPSPVMHKRRQTGASVLMQLLKNSTRWLTSHVLVVSQLKGRQELPGLSVKNLPAAGQRTQSA